MNSLQRQHIEEQIFYHLDSHVWFVVHQRMSRIVEEKFDVEPFFGSIDMIEEQVGMCCPDNVALNRSLYTYSF